MALFGLACWAYADWDFKYFINTLEMRHFHDGTAVLLTAAILAALAPLIGCLGAMGESRGALLVVSFFFLLVLLKQQNQIKQFVVTKCKQGVTRLNSNRTSKERYSN